MKGYLSVLMLFVRSTFYRFLLIVFAMAVVESIFFTIAIRSVEGYFGLDTVLIATRPQIVFAVCFLLLCALMCLTGCGFGSKQGYTLSRLRVSNRTVFLCQAVNNAGLLFLFWAAQVGVILVFCGIYASLHPQPQATMLVFYSNNFLHSLFPLAEKGHLVCNAVLLIVLALTSACFPIHVRRGTRPIAIFVIALICILFFIREKGAVISNIALSITTVSISAFAVIDVLREVYDEDLS